MPDSCRFTASASPSSLQGDADSAPHRIFFDSYQRFMNKGFRSLNPLKASSKIPAIDILGIP
jgi:hypothetical protein